MTLCHVCIKQLIQLHNLNLLKVVLIYILF